MKKFIILAVLKPILYLTMNTEVYVAHIATDGLVSYWTFDLYNINDNTAEDVWAENDATIKGNPWEININASLKMNIPQQLQPNNPVEDAVAVKLNFSENIMLIQTVDLVE